MIFTLSNSKDDHLDLNHNPIIATTTDRRPMRIKFTMFNSAKILNNYLIFD